MRPRAEVVSAAAPVAARRSAPPPARRRAGWTGLLWDLTLRALVSPSLARDLVRVAWRFRRRRWFLRPPFLPLPSRTYVRWRMQTAYGDERAVPPWRDVVRYARWVGRGR